jgi:hypothetical protein
MWLNSTVYTVQYWTLSFLKSSLQSVLAHPQKTLKSVMIFRKQIDKSAIVQYTQLSKRNHRRIYIEIQYEDLHLDMSWGSSGVLR